MTSMAMNKSGNTNLTVNGAWTIVTGWVTRSGYPSTVISGNRLVLDQSGTGTITFRGQFSVSSSQELRVVLNGATTPVVVAGPVPLNTELIVPGVTVSAGDTLELQAFAPSSFADTVVGGATATYLIYDQTSQGYNFDVAAPATNWGTTAAVGKSAPADAAGTTVAWGRTAQMSQGAELSLSRPTNWGITADIYQGIHWQGEAARPIGWNISAEMDLIPDVTSLPSVFEDTQLAVSVHTADGRIVGDFPCNVIGNFNFGREATEVSTASFQVMTQGAPDLVEDLRQWVHWVTLWLGDQAVWTGPIWNVKISKTVTTVSARDPSIFMWRTRVPITRTFTDSAPARIADTVWRLMNQLHGIRATPLVLPGVAEDTFTVAAAADTRMLHQFMDELVKVGLQWTVVAGRPVLGEFPREPVAELQECDFLVEIERVRDGSQVFNDVRVQGQNWASTAIAPLAGLHLQGLVSLDDMFGASNIQRATQQYARQVATLRDDLVVPAQASLHPQAPVTYDDLIPGKVFAVYTETASQLMRLDQVNISGSPDAFDVQITLVALQATTEIETIGDTT